MAMAMAMALIKNIFSLAFDLFLEDALGASHSDYSFPPLDKANRDLSRFFTLSTWWGSWG